MKSSLPKVLHTMCGRTLVGHVLAAGQGINPRYLVAVVRHERDAVAETVLAEFPDAVIADQDDIPGTGRAVWCALEALPADLTGPVIVTAGDTPLLDTATLSQLIEKHGDNAVTVLTTLVDDATGYGRIVRTSDGAVCAVVEHKDASPDELEINEINTSTYVFDAAYLRDALTRVGTGNAQGEMYLTDVVALAHDEGAGVGSLVVADSVVVEGVNDQVQLADLRAQMNRRLCERAMREGAVIEDPTTTYLDAQVTVEPGATVHPHTILAGHTVVRAGAVAGPFARLTNVTVEPGRTYALTDLAE